MHRVFVTPEYAGWRLIYAESPPRETPWWPHEVVERLSAACGRARVFFQDRSPTPSSGPLPSTAPRGRGYWRYGEPEWPGEPLPREEPPDAEGPEDGLDGLGGLGEDGGESNASPVRGHGRPAVTAPGAGHHGFAGAPVPRAVGARSRCARPHLRRTAR
ncbi:hypothetical protein [Kitasatospora purpeofusca]|uniref:hypothetical protein n=1 Tax=Kitasatospora purpeofusca TaxID=67352 RepID=UPI0036D32DEE